jgi:hypothetical protein
MNIGGNPCDERSLQYRATRFLGVVHVAHWRASAPVHHTVHRKVCTYQIAITRYIDLVALYPFPESGPRGAPLVRYQCRAGRRNAP